MRSDWIVSELEFITDNNEFANHVGMTQNAKLVLDRDHSRRTHLVEQVDHAHEASLVVNAHALTVISPLVGWRVEEAEVELVIVHRHRVVAPYRVVIVAWVQVIVDRFGRDVACCGVNAESKVLNLIAGLNGREVLSSSAFDHARARRTTDDIGVGEIATVDVTWCYVVSGCASPVAVSPWSIAAICPGSKAAMSPRSIAAIVSSVIPSIA